MKKQKYRRNRQNYKVDMFCWRRGDINPDCMKEGMWSVRFGGSTGLLRLSRILCIRWQRGQNSEGSQLRKADTGEEKSPSSSKWRDTGRGRSC